MRLSQIRTKRQVEPYTEVVTSERQQGPENAAVKPAFNKHRSVEIPQPCTMSTWRNALPRVAQGLSRAALKGTRARVELAPGLQVFIQGREECIIRRRASGAVGQYLH